ncbi:MAG: hypothetical protein OWQ54_01210 [Sulfolobaceae archaeon]|nr:hypothetical protein [Sulfolobaceae archaeon]
MKLRIDKIPKSEEDLEKIQEEVESEERVSHEHEHAHSEEEEIINSLFSSLQALNQKVSKMEEADEDCRKEIANIYKILGKLVEAVFANNEDDKIKSLKEILSFLE